MGKYNIAVYAICKNEEKFVDRWVDSMSEADVIVVVDTGSTDSTIKKLKIRGIDVHSVEVKPWRFDIPRNIALGLVPEDIDICVATDLDEVFEVGWREKLENIWKVNTARVLYTFVGSFHQDGTPDKVFMKDKIHSRHLYRWSRPVHEVLDYISKGEEKIISEPSIVLKHYPDYTKSREQYLPLLELTVEEFPNDDRSMHYLGREYMFNNMYDKAIEKLEEHLNMPSATWKEERCASMRFISRCYLSIGNRKKAKEWLQKAIQESPYTREPYAEMAQFYYGEENWQEIYNNVEIALSIEEQAKSYLTERFCWDSTLYDLGGISCFYLGMYEKALEYTKIAIELAPHDERLKENLKIVEKIAKS